MLLLGFYGFYVYQSSLKDWKIDINSNNKTQISWIKFVWSKDTISGQIFNKSAMIIPCKIDGIENVVTFQFDLGSNESMIYENNFSSLYSKNKLLANNIYNFNFPLNFFNKRKLFKDLKLTVGDNYFINKNALVYGDYGDKYSIESVKKNDTIHIGTIGTDLLKNKVLIIDYPKNRFAICETVPLQFEKNIYPIEIEDGDQVIIPLKIKGKTRKVTFDTGSSLFPIIASSEDRPKYSTNKKIDSIEVSSWGEMHYVDSRMVTDTFEILGKKYCNVKIYENHSGKGISTNDDGMIGNFLLWNNVVIIDFKNKKMGIK